MPILQRIVDFLREFNVMIDARKLLWPTLDAACNRISMYQPILIKQDINRNGRCILLTDQINIDLYTGLLLLITENITFNDIQIAGNNFN